MSAIGSLVFCTDCGNLLDSSTGNKDTILVCECCGAENKDTASKTITTQTKPASFPSLLRQKRSAIQQVDLSEMQSEAVIAQTCPECGRQEVRYTAVQLRSADEGSTIFYTCDCGHKWNTNN
ncbi:transcription factor S-II-domain-containing protein [Cadophora sp. MPI-SDFR-AT-0126]|nr:transcription factor S-II-domain-containing protein [Leotiomycetes sp. MPI-SDFR-AT-0126]